jgi:hypothetical protein
VFSRTGKVHQPRPFPAKMALHGCLLPQEAGQESRYGPNEWHSPPNVGFPIQNGNAWERARGRENSEWGVRFCEIVRLNYDRNQGLSQGQDADADSSALGADG